MLVHILLVIFVTFLIIWSVETSGGYSRSELAIFYKMFVDESIEVNQVDFETTRYFYNISEVTGFVNEWVDNYYSLEVSETLERYFIPKIFNQTTQKYEDNPINLEVFYRKRHDRQDSQNISYSITKNYRGPFEYEKEELRYFISNSTHFQFVYNIENTLKK